MDSLLIKTKFSMPQTGQFIIRRPRINQKLDLCIKHKLTLVTAPSGYGKSTAVREWAAGSGLPCAWVASDAGDNEPVVFWKYVCSALDGIIPGVSKDAEYVFSSKELLEANTQIKIILERLSELTGDYVLIVDDIHYITNMQIYKGLGYLLDYMPESLHLLLIGREEQENELAGLELKSRFQHIRTVDLRFRKEEISEFFNIRELILEASELSRLETYTEGWAAALVAVAMSAEKNPEFRFETLLADGCNHSIDQYLRDKVISFWQEGKLKFALDTSIVETLCEGLCFSITGRKDSARLLAEMTEKNEFMKALGGGYYACHNLFRRFLLARLGRYMPEMVPELHCRAAEWYEEQGQYFEAITHYLEGGKYDSAGTLIDQQLGELVIMNAYDTGISWINRLPADIREKSPKMAAFFCMYHSEYGRFDEAAKWIRKADGLIEAGD
ncbi:MAG: hypothetical protein HGA22_14905, partial [Clostridiales bacterium]|nr:hypothetical protein [Clostridiales bacterium]